MAGRASRVASCSISLDSDTIFVFGGLSSVCCALRLFCNSTRVELRAKSCGALPVTMTVVEGKKARGEKKNISTAVPDAAQSEVLATL